MLGEGAYSSELYPWPIRPKGTNPRANLALPPLRAEGTPAERVPSRLPASASFPIAPNSSRGAQLAGSRAGHTAARSRPLPGARGNDAPSHHPEAFPAPFNSFALTCRQAVERVCRNVFLLLRLPLLHDEQHGTKEFLGVGKLFKGSRNV